MAQATSEADTGALSVGFLGPLRVVRHGAPLVLGGRQQKAVLGVLVSEANSVVSVARLTEAVWGEQVGNRAVAAVQTYVSRLRDVLEPDRPRGVGSQVLSTEPGGYRLRVPDHDIDAVVFEQRVQLGRALHEERRYAEASAELSAALAMWRGPVLADLADFEFAKLAAVRLGELRLLALEDRIEADIALGRHREVAGELDALIATHPLREGLHAKRMVARYRSGRQGEALSGYQEFRALLADEMGIDPGPELKKLYQAVLTRDTSLDSTAEVATLEQRSAGQHGAEQRSAGPEPRPGSPPSRQRPRRWRLVVLAGTVVVALVTGATAVLLIQSRSRTLSVFPANSLGRIDSRGGLRSATSIGQSPSGVAYGAGSLWVANSDDDTVSRVDPNSGRLIQTLRVGGSPNAVAVLNEDVWVTNGGAGTVSRINAPDNEQVQLIPVGNQPTAIAAGPSGVWVANSGDDTIQRLDPITGAAGDPISVGAYPDGLAVGTDSVWVANGRDGTVLPVNFSGNTSSPIVVGAGPKGMALTADSLWVANSLDLSVTRIGLNDARVEQTIPVGDGPNSVVAAGKAVWVSNEFDGTVTRIDPATGKADRRIATGSSPHGMVMIGSSPWVTTGGFANAEHKGGTLTVEQDWVPGGPSIDFYYYYDQPTLAMLYDGLVALRRSGGAAGLTLVPDLAVALPRATDGGRIYTFTLRKGIHYSTGAEVRPADIRRGLLRALRGPAAAYYSSVLGAKECIASASRCGEIARGLMIDENSWHVTFRLSDPDPEFLYKLSSFVYATPPAVPIGESPDPIPTTGPYMVVGYKKGVKELTLVRNPYFKQWSFAARPNGFPDTIHFTKVAAFRTRLDDVFSGRNDLLNFTYSELPPDVARDLIHRYPRQLHSDFGLGHFFVWLDTRVAPFNDLRVRRALNYAVDRRTLAAMLGGSAVKTPTCQFDPPNFPGYRPYCPYTRAAGTDGRYSGPDLAAARGQVTASKTAGMSLIVSTRGDDGPNSVLVAQYYVALLNKLGYHAKRDRAGNGYDGDPFAQLGVGYWGVDFPAPSNFWAPLLSCSSVRPRGAPTLNFGGYCNPAIDRLAKRALTLEVADPTTARQLWTEVDHKLTDDAALAFGVATRQAALVSADVGNYQANPVLGPLIDQMWVR